MQLKAEKVDKLRLAMAINGMPIENEKKQKMFELIKTSQSFSCGDDLHFEFDKETSGYVMHFDERLLNCEKKGGHK